MDFATYIDNRLNELRKNYEELAKNIEVAKVNLERLYGSIVELDSVKKTHSNQEKPEEEFYDKSEG